MSLTATQMSALKGELQSYVEDLSQPTGQPRTVSVTFTATPRPNWIAKVMEDARHLPWHEHNMPDDRQPTQVAPATALLFLLLETMEDNSMPPTALVPTSRGGAAAEWHTRGFHLEIESNPGEVIEYSFSTPEEEEYDGPAGPDLAPLRARLRRLSST